MKTFIERLLFSKALQIEVIDPIIVEEKTNVEKFDNWMQKNQNIYRGNNEKMERAYNLIIG